MSCWVRHILVLRQEPWSKHIAQPPSLVLLSIQPVLNFATQGTTHWVAIHCTNRKPCQIKRRPLADKWTHSKPSAESCAKRSKISWSLTSSPPLSLLGLKRQLKTSVNSKGGISPRGDGGAAAERQAQRLRAEGVEVDDRNGLDEASVDLSKFGWFPEDLPDEPGDEAWSVGHVKLRTRTLCCIVLDFTLNILAQYSKLSMWGMPLFRVANKNCDGGRIRWKPIN